MHISGLIPRNYAELDEAVRLVPASPLAEFSVAALSKTLHRLLSTGMTLYPLLSTGSTLVDSSRQYPPTACHKIRYFDEQRAITLAAIGYESSFRYLSKTFWC